MIKLGDATNVININSRETKVICSKTNCVSLQRRKKKEKKSIVIIIFNLDAYITLAICLWKTPTVWV